MEGTFKNLLENPPEIIHKTTEKIINSQLDIKRKQFTEEEIDSVLKKTKKLKNLQASTKYMLKYGRQENLMTYFFGLSNPVRKQNSEEKSTKDCTLPQKGNLRICNYCRRITYTARVVKVYNTTLLNRIQLKIQKFLRKNQNGFRRNRYST